MYSNGVERRGDEEKLLSNLGGAPRPSSPLSKEAKEAVAPPTTREQVLPILNYCAASIMMTVVNKVSSAWHGVLRVCSRRRSSSQPP